MPRSWDVGSLRLRTSRRDLICDRFAVLNSDFVRIGSNTSPTLLATPFITLPLPVQSPGKNGDGESSASHWLLCQCELCLKNFRSAKVKSLSVLYFGYVDLRISSKSCFLGVPLGWTISLWRNDRKTITAKIVGWERPQEPHLYADPLRSLLLCFGSSFLLLVASKVKLSSSERLV